MNIDVMVTEALEAVRQAPKDAEVDRLLRDVTASCEAIVKGASPVGLPRDVQRLYSAVLAQVVQALEEQLKSSGRKLEDVPEALEAAIVGVSAAVRAAHRVLA